MDWNSLFAELNRCHSNHGSLSDGSIIYKGFLFWFLEFHRISTGVLDFPAAPTKWKLQCQERQQNMDDLHEKVRMPWSCKFCTFYLSWMQALRERQRGLLLLDALVKKSQLLRTSKCSCSCLHQRPIYTMYYLPIIFNRHICDIYVCICM